jgi:hypothetical protein
MPAAVTRSLLGYGLLAGVLYLTVGIVLALTRAGFELSTHPLSLLMLGEGGWMQRVNIMVAGAMTVLAAWGFARALRGTPRRRVVSVAIGIYGGALVLSGVFPPDPVAGFPPGTTSGDPSLAGVLHMGFGAVGFFAIAAAGSAMGRWFAAKGMPVAARSSGAAALTVVVAFIGGAALATQTAGVVLLWIAVLAAWGWLGGTSVRLYRLVPHPDASRRAIAPGI